MKTPMPNTAKLTNEIIRESVHEESYDSTDTYWWNRATRRVADAAAEHAWHARDDEVAELQEYKDNNDYTEGIHIRYLEQTLARIAKERDAALEQVGIWEVTVPDLTDRVAELVEELVNVAGILHNLGYPTGDVDEVVGSSS